MSLSRAALFGAAAISGDRVAKNSCSCNLIRSQGGFPSTTSNPPPCMISPNARCQWKNWCRRASSLVFASTLGRCVIPILRRLRSSVWGTQVSVSFVLGAKYAPTNRLARSSSSTLVSSVRAATQALDFRSMSASDSSGIASMSAAASATSNTLSSSNRPRDAVSPIWLFRFLIARQAALSSPVRSLYASPGMPVANTSGSSRPTRLSPSWMWASRKVSGLPGSMVSIHKAVLHNSTASGFRSTPWMQCWTTSRSACCRAASSEVSTPASMRAISAAMRRAAASRKCPEPHAGSSTLRSRMALRGSSGRRATASVRTGSSADLMSSFTKDDGV